MKEPLQVWQLRSFLVQAAGTFHYVLLFKRKPNPLHLLCAMEADGWTCVYQGQESKEKCSYRVSASITAYAPHSHMRDRY